MICDMNLYSITIEYDVSEKYEDDTLIEQVYAKSPDDAVLLWAKSMDLKKYPEIGKKVHKKLIEELSDPDNLCVKVNDRINMWCSSALVRALPIALHIIKTSTD